ncbi:hypothetical protein ACFVWL_10280 [Microbacterium sp. NPDC058269]|uniref:hypothetical protein n=1 Tax=Microbacterium sp. NPDC058269 TaxID=3346414 RepID=UPI0036DA144F
MTSFTSSSGIIRVEHEGSPEERVDIYSARSGENMLEGMPWLGHEEVRALREFFQHERDEELGRWRWPENPDYVVYSNPDEAFERMFGPNLDLVILRDSDGMTKGYVREEDQGGPPMDHRIGHMLAARAYFEAHPERKPWEAAAAGELWAFNTDPGTRETLWERDTSESRWHLPGQAKAVLGVHFTIVTGRKIWPEDAS